MNSLAGTINSTDIKNAGVSAFFYTFASVVGLTIFYTILSLQTQITPLLLTAGVSSTAITVIFNVGRQLYNAFYAGDNVNQIENLVIDIATKYLSAQQTAIVTSSTVTTPTITSSVTTPVNVTSNVSVPTI